MREMRLTSPQTDSKVALAGVLAPAATLPVEVPQQRVQDDTQDVFPAPRFAFDVALVGLGYVGLPTALAFHAAGRSVLGLDVSSARRAAIFSQAVDLLPSDRERLAASLASDSGFDVTGDVQRLREAAAIIIAVPTPIDEHLLPDLSILRSACADVVANAVAGQVIILTSTTYVGSTFDLVVGPLEARGFAVGSDIHVAFSPERIDPGNDRFAHEDVPRVVGGVTPECSRRTAEIVGTYANKVHEVSSPKAAEMTKLWENTFRAVNIAFANEMAEASKELELDVREVIEAAATKPFGFMPFFPGPGVGGHCIPCDPHYLLWQLRGSRSATPVVQQAMSAIAARPHRVVDRTREVLSQHGLGISGARVLVLGVAYKPDVEDVRESPALEIMSELRRFGAEVVFHDPVVLEIQGHDGSAEHSVDLDAVDNADIVLVHTLHSSVDHAITSRARLVLDATYRLPAASNRFVL
jgi:UDP-N-acetyl-D-glucosamine dehydrogenase